MWPWTRHSPFCACSPRRVPALRGAPPHPRQGPAPTQEFGEARGHEQDVQFYLCFCTSREGDPACHLHVGKGSSGCVVLRGASSRFPRPSCPSFGHQGLLHLDLCSVFQRATCDVRGTQSCTHQKPWPTLAALQLLCRVVPALPFTLPGVSSSLPVSSSAPNPRGGCGRGEAGASEGGSAHLGSPASQSGGKVWAQAPCPWDRRAHQRSSCPPREVWGTLQ